MAVIDRLRVKDAITGNITNRDIGAKAENVILQNGTTVEEALHSGGAGNVLSVNSKTGAVVLDADDVGAIPATEKGVANGVAELGANGRVLPEQLPGSLGYVYEAADKESFPATGDANTMYIALDTNKVYRWGGTVYVEISEGVVIGTTSSSAHRGDHGAAAYNHASAKGDEFASGFYKIETNSEGHVTAATPVTKTDITDLGINDLQNIKDGSGTGAIIEGAVKEIENYDINGDGSDLVTIIPNVANGDFAHAEGISYIRNNEERKNIASGIGSHAEGNATTSSNYYTHAEGQTTLASNQAAHAEGYNTTASGYQSHAEGQTTLASAANAHAEGYNNIASGVSSHAEGTNNTASAERTHAEGNQTVANGVLGHAEGQATTASGLISHAEGYKTSAAGQATHAEGYGTTAKGDESHSEGLNTRAEATGSHSEGYSSPNKNKHIIASGIGSHAEGAANNNNLLAKGYAAHAEGMETTAYGDFSHASGYRTKATKDYCYTEGMLTVAYGIGGHAEGANSSANEGSHAEGGYTLASGNGSHTEGSSTTASGSISHAEGVNSLASGAAAHAQGVNTIAQGGCQTVIGKFNVAQGSDSIEDTDYALIIGNGTTNDARSNALAVKWDGTVVFADGTEQNSAFSLTNLKTLVAASSDFADFQARIAAL